MENQREIWEENYKLTRMCTALCLLASVVCFAVAILAHFVFSSSLNTSLSDNIVQDYGLIGMITFGALALACYLSYMKENSRSLSNLSQKEIETHQASLRTLRGVTILLFMLFGVCNFFTPTEDIINLVKGNLVSLVLVAIGFGTFLLGLLSHSMARTIKTKHLNN